MTKHPSPKAHGTRFWPNDDQTSLSLWPCSASGGVDGQAQLPDRIRPLCWCFCLRRPLTEEARLPENPHRVFNHCPLCRYARGYAVALLSLSWLLIAKVEGAGVENYISGLRTIGSSFLAPYGLLEHFLTNALLPFFSDQRMVELATLACIRS